MKSFLGGSLTCPHHSGPAGAALHGYRWGVLRVLDAAHVPQPLRDDVHGARARMHRRRTEGVPRTRPYHDVHLTRFARHQQVGVNCFFQTFNVGL